MRSGLRLKKKLGHSSVSNIETKQKMIAMV